jgi:hypothetical protein
MNTKSYNIAVCLSGELRTWESCADNIKNFFESDDVTVTYFAHTWDISFFHKENEKKLVVHNLEEIERVKTKFNMSDKQIIFDNKKTIQPNIQNKQRIPGLDVTSEFTQMHSANCVTPITWCHMSKSIMMSNQLKKNYELVQDKKFDIVVRCRFDNFFNPETKFKQYLTTSGIYPVSLYGTFHYFPKENFLPCIDDVIFFGSSRIMDVVCDLYRYYSNEKFYELLDVDWNDPAYATGGYGICLYKWITIKNISMAQIPFFDYSIFRKFCTGMTNYQEILNLATKVYSL